MRATVFVALLVLGAVLSGCFTTGDGKGGAERAAVERIGPVPPGTYRFDSFARVVTDGTLAALSKEMIYLPSETDGVDVEITLWRPDTDAAVPVLVDAGPYFGPGGSVAFSSAAAATDSGHIGRLITNFLPLGYAVAAVAVRGTGGSGGCMDMMGPLEVADVDQAITWLGTQDWSNGNVAMIGKSYDGSTPWQVAGRGNPYLKTIVPMSGVPDVYELMFRNGTSEIRGPFLLNALYYSFALREPSTDLSDTGEAQRRVQNTVEGTACADHVEGMLAPMYSGVDGGRDPFGFWAARNLKPGVEANYKGSVLHVQGLQDWNVDPGLNLPWVDNLNKSGVPVHQMLGQWGHSYPDDADDGPNARWDWAEILLRWFDRELKGLDVAVGPAVQVLDSTGRWRVEDAWPPRDAEWLAFNLSADATLQEGAAQAGRVLLAPNTVTGAFDQQQGLLPPETGRADFVTEAAPKDLLIAGLPKVPVIVTPTGTHGHVAAWLYSVAPDGVETRIGMTMISLRFADGTAEPKEVMPNEPLRLAMELQPLDVVVPAGHHLLLRIWQYRDTPQQDVADDPAQGKVPVLPPQPLYLEVGGDSGSQLRLPVIERGPDVYFTPPQAP